MKIMFPLVLLAALSIAFMTPAMSQAQDFPAFGNVRAAAGPVYSPVYTPGYNSVSTARNGAIHSYYSPGHPSFANDRGPTYYTPGFHSYYQAPGSLHYYYGSYTPLYRSYANRR